MKSCRSLTIKRIRTPGTHHSLPTLADCANSLILETGTYEYCQTSLRMHLPELHGDFMCTFPTTAPHGKTGPAVAELTFYHFFQRPFEVGLISILNRCFPFDQLVLPIRHFVLQHVTSGKILQHSTQAIDDSICVSSFASFQPTHVSQIHQPRN